MSAVNAHQLGTPDPAPICGVGSGAEPPAATFNAALAISSGIVCDHGGTASHAAIMAREFHIPAVLGAGKATSAIIDEATFTVDPAAGSVSVA